MGHLEALGRVHAEIKQLYLYTDMLYSKEAAEPSEVDEIATLLTDCCEALLELDITVTDNTSEIKTY
jgi:hypothetical protein